MTVNESPMIVTADTKISEVLARYGDIADVMETLGIRRVAKYDVRKLAAKLLTVRRAAFVHRLSVDEMVASLQSAITSTHTQQAAAARSKPA